MKEPATGSPQAVKFVAGRIAWFNSIAIDDRNRLAFTANMTTGKVTLFLWDQNHIRQVFEIRQKDPNGRAYILGQQPPGCRLAVLSPRRRRGPQRAHRGRGNHRSRAGV